METNETDEELVLRYGQFHDERAFKSLMERYNERVHQLVAAILGHVYRAELNDVVQEIFVRVYRGLPTFHGHARFSTWIYRIAYNHSVNYKIRSYKRRKYVTLASAEDMVACDSLASKKLEQQQRYEQLNAAIDRLPSEYQAVVRLYYWQQLPIQEIGVLLSIRENTVKSYLHRARKLLAVQLQREKDSL